MNLETLGSGTFMLDDAVTIGRQYGLCIRILSYIKKTGYVNHAGKRGRAATG
jgi:hypothetical protein